MKKISLLLAFIIGAPLSAMNQQQAQPTQEQLAAAAQPQDVASLTQERNAKIVNDLQQKLKEHLDFSLDAPANDQLNTAVLNCLELRDTNGATPLINAAGQGDVELASAILRAQYKNFHVKDKLGDTAFDKAVENGHIGIALLLLNSGYSLQGTDGNNYTALHRAAVLNRTKAIGVLIKLGASIDAQDANGLTPLYYAVTHNNPQACAELLKYKADVLKKAPDGYCALQLSRYYKTDTKKRIESIKGTRPKQPESEIITACNHINSLIEHRYQSVMQAHGITPLMQACNDGKPDEVEALLNNPAIKETINAQDYSGKTATMYALWQNNGPLIQLLHHAQARFDLADNEDRNTLHYAIDAGDIDAVELILKNIQADNISEYINAPDDEGKTPLMFAAAGIDDNIVKLLIKKGANVLATSNNKSALDIAQNSLQMIIEDFSDLNREDLAQNNRAIIDLLTVATERTRISIIQKAAKQADQKFNELMQEVASQGKKKKTKKKNKALTVQPQQQAMPAQTQAAQVMAPAQQAQASVELKEATPQGPTFTQLKRKARIKEKKKLHNKKDPASIARKQQEKEEAEGIEQLRLAQIAQQEQEKQALQEQRLGKKAAKKELRKKLEQTAIAHKNKRVLKQCLLELGRNAKNNQHDELRAQNFASQKNKATQQRIFAHLHQHAKSFKLLDTELAQLADIHHTRVIRLRNKTILSTWYRASQDALANRLLGNDLTQVVANNTVLATKNDERKKQ